MFLVEKLARELPRQYESPQDLSIFGNEIAFRDPVTDLRGKGNYRRMLVSVMLFFRLVCKPSSAYFKLVSIERSGDDKIRTVWETGATTWTGRELFISGVDFFTVEENGRISRHDSEWDQSWEEVRSQVL